MDSPKPVPKSAETPDEILKFLSRVWLSKLDKAQRHKKSFNDDAARLGTSLMGLLAGFGSRPTPTTRAATTAASIPQPFA